MVTCSLDSLKAQQKGLPVPWWQISSTLSILTDAFSSSWGHRDRLQWKHALQLSNCVVQATQFDRECTAFFKLRKHFPICWGEGFHIPLFKRCWVKPIYTSFLHFLGVMLKQGQCRGAYSLEVRISHNNLGPSKQCPKTLSYIRKSTYLVVSRCLTCYLNRLRGLGVLVSAVALSRLLTWFLSCLLMYALVNHCVTKATVKGKPKLVPEGHFCISKSSIGSTVGEKTIQGCSCCIYKTHTPLELTVSEAQSQTLLPTGTLLQTRRRRASRRQHIHVCICLLPSLPP